MRLSLAIVGLLLVVVGSAVYSHPMSEDRKVMIQVTKIGPVLHGDTSPKWIKFYSALGDNLVIDRLELTNSSTMWKNLKEEDTVIFHHYIEYWPLFGKVIEKNHQDQLLDINASEK